MNTIDTQHEAEQLIAAIGQQLAVERKARGFNQKQAGAALGLSQKTMSDIERGASPTMTHYIRYSTWVGIDFVILAERASMVLRSRALADVQIDKEVAP